MPYVSIARIAQGIKSLQRFHAFFGVTFLSMKQAGVGVATPKTWGSPQEDGLLRKYYAPSGAPPDKPYFVPFGKEREDSGSWKNPKFSSGSLQRARTTDTFAPAFLHPDKSTWSFKSNYLPVLEGLLPKDSAGQRIKLPIFDLISWLYRGVDLPASLDAVEAKFRTEFGLTDDTEYSTLFDRSPESPEGFFFAEPPDENDLIRLIGGVPTGADIGSTSEADFIARIEKHVVESEKLTLPAGFVKSFYYALKTQRFVVLAGRPGTGKTAFARAYSNALKEMFPGAVCALEVGVSPEFGEADAIGYEKISGGLAASELTKKVFLSGRPNDIYVVILDEMNLAQVDHYLARILPAIESDSTVELPGDAGVVNLPADAYFVGTVNSYLEELTRQPLSGPVKRRVNVIEMPNHLDSVVKRNDLTEFRQVAISLIEQTKQRVQTRRARGVNSVLDGFRLSSLDAALAAGSPVLSDTFLTALSRLCQICAAQPVTSLTFGVLQDVLDYVALSGPDVLLSLDQQIAQKVAPQLSGPSSIVRNILALTDELSAVSGAFPESSRALQALLTNEDASSLNVTYPY